MSTFAVWGLLAVSIACSSIAQIFQKRAAATLSQHSLRTLLFSQDIILSIFFLGCGLLSWLVVLAYLPVSVAYPLLSLSYVVVMLLAHRFFNERITLRRWLGTGLIMLGVGLLAGAT